MARVAVVCTQRGGGRATGLPDGDTPLGEGIDGTSGGMPTACVTNDFAALAIFLIVEGEGGVHCLVQVGLGGGGGVQFVVLDGEGDVAQAQGVVVRCVAIFTGAQQEEKGNPNHVDGGGEFGRGGCEGKGRGMVDDLDGEGFDAVWGWIFVGVGRVQPREPWVHESSRREEWVGDPCQ